MRLSKLTIFFGLFIVISASFMRQGLDFLYARIGEKTTEITLGICFTLIVLAIVLRIIPLRIRAMKKTVFFIVLALGFYSSWRLEIVAERIHILEYGLLGYLAARDVLKKTMGLNFIAFIIMTVAIFALLDEGLQYILPYRYWDLRDVVFNLAGGIWGLALFLIKKEPKS